MATMNDVRFHEVQRFRQWWLWALLLLIATGAWGWFLAQVVLGLEVGPKTAPDWSVAVMAAVFGTAMPLWFVWLAMETTVDSREVRLRFWPLADVRVPRAQVASVEAVTYSPIGEYGGWGVRWGGRRNWCYNVSGDRGVRVTRTDGSLILIGSQHADELAEAIRPRD
jgi:hypothetical protein